jgi:hypothetical protein
VTCPEDVLALMQRASARRQVGETKVGLYTLIPVYP